MLFSFGLLRGRKNRKNVSRFLRQNKNLSPIFVKINLWEHKKLKKKRKSIFKKQFWLFWLIRGIPYKWNAFSRKMTSKRRHHKFYVGLKSYPTKICQHFHVSFIIGKNSEDTMRSNMCIDRYVQPSDVSGDIIF